jgi:ankyrin repeat protein
VIRALVVVAVAAGLLASGCAGEGAPVEDPERDAELIAAAEAGALGAVERLLETGADVAAVDAGGRTALVAAAYRNDVDVAQALIDAGADVNHGDGTQQSAYLIATSEVGDDPRLLELALAGGADVDALDSYDGTGLIRAAERGHVSIVRRLLETDVVVDHVNRLGWTALLEAVILGDGGPRHTEVVRLLVEGGADVDLADANGVTPLAHARDGGHDAIVALLEPAGASG